MTNSHNGREDDSFASLFEKADAPKRQRRLSVGDEIDGVVIKIGTDAVFVDLDGKREAFIDRESLQDAAGEPIRAEVGDAVRATIVEMGGRAGGIRLEPVAIRRPGQDEDSAEEQVELVGSGPKLATGAHVMGQVVRIEPYGVFVQIEGTTGREGRGLLPAVETGFPRGTDLRKKLPVGTQLEVKILSIEDDGKMRLSIRALQADEERASFEKYTGKGESKSKEGRGNAGFGTLADAFARSQARKPKKR
ncbi:MAG: S1 RNA-binding domain-containing protein [Myxococcota bacterium]